MGEPFSDANSKTFVTRRKQVGASGLLERFSMLATEWAGSSLAFSVALSIIVVWVVTGPLFGFSDTWQLVINTGTTIVTFLMVFLIQRTQNKESKIVQLKLSEIVAALQGASNRLIDVESSRSRSSRCCIVTTRRSRSSPRRRPTWGRLIPSTRRRAVTPRR